MQPRQTRDPLPPSSEFSFHDRALDEIWRALRSSPDGLSSTEAARRRAEYGANVLPEARPPGWLVLLARQLRSPLVYVLLAAAAVSFAMGHAGDAAFIGVVLLVNSGIGFSQELSAERQSQALRQMLRIRATVLREGQVVEIDATDLVPGDIVVVESGQRIAADIRLIEARGLEVDESVLTGESMVVSKDPDWFGSADAALADRLNMLHAGSRVARGRARGIVVATAGATELGRLAHAMATIEGGKPPLIERMERFSRAIAITVLAAAAAVALLAILVHQRDPAEMFVFGVALAVAAIPEGLPVALTVALAIAARRMARRGAIVRQLPAVEGLGSCSLIASDKTGTLTCNELTVTELWLARGRSRYVVTGTGYTPSGTVTPSEGSDASPDALEALLEVAVACNEAELESEDGSWRGRGDPTDIALLVAARKVGLEPQALRESRPEIDAIPFEPERQYAAVLRARDSGRWLAVKGAPERVLAMSAVETVEADAIRRAADRMAERGLRVLAFASAVNAADIPDLAAEPARLTFLGLAGIRDPVRPGAREAVAACHAAGISVKMITGDHPATALAIASELGIAGEGDPVVTGADLAHRTGPDIDRLVTSADVFARVSPAQKLALVEAAQRNGDFIAVTGDGVNDAPALKRANIGVAMGRCGTDAARDAADLVLTDDNFATIVAGIEEGRVAYRNVRNVVYLLIAAGIAEVLTIGVAVAIGLPIPLLPVQILWLNVVTNGIQDVALAFERRTGDELAAPVRRPSEPLIDRIMIARGLLAGGWMSVLGLGGFVVMLRFGVGIEEARNALLLLMTLMQNIDAFNARSETRSIFRLPLRNNPVLAWGVAAAIGAQVVAMHYGPLQQILRTAPVSPVVWLVATGLAMSLLIVMESQKRFLIARGPVSSAVAAIGKQDTSRP
jgi:magnesium-transporting ATPase (P-type)